MASKYRKKFSLTTDFLTVVLLLLPRKLLSIKTIRLLVRAIFALGLNLMEVLHRYLDITKIKRFSDCDNLGS
jgi:hypothetical protein